MNQNAESTAIVFARATHMPALDDGSPDLSVMKASSKNCWSVTDHLRLLDVIWLDVKEDAEFSDDERLTDERGHEKSVLFVAKRSRTGLLTEGIGTFARRSIDQTSVWSDWSQIRSASMTCAGSRTVTKLVQVVPLLNPWQERLQVGPREE